MTFHTRRSPRVRLLLVVVLAHGAALLLLRATGVWHDRTQLPNSLEPLVVQLMYTPAEAARREDSAPALPTATSRPQRSAPQADAVQVPAAAALPQPPAVATEPAPAPAPARPLLLDLPRKASAPLAERHPGLDDPRANGTGPTLESRIGRAVGSAELIEEHLGDGRIRFRKGSGCVELRPNSAG
jgi:hypothetical protein